jgi:hypothetical protein
MSERQDVTFTVNDEVRMICVEPRRSLADALRVWWDCIIGFAWVEGVGVYHGWVARAD